jgi:hypothetical protein
MTIQSPPRADATVRCVSVLDTLRIGAAVLTPTIARGVLARRPRIVAPADALDADRRAGRPLPRTLSPFDLRFDVRHPSTERISP